MKFKVGDIVRYTGSSETHRDRVVRDTDIVTYDGDRPTGYEWALIQYKWATPAVVEVTELELVPKRYVVEYRPPKKGEQYVAGMPGRLTAHCDYAECRSVIVEEL